jgi:hypothetical protein
MPTRAALPLPQTPIVNPNEVKGFCGNQEVPPDRYFYFLNESDETLWQSDGYKVTEKNGRECWSILMICPVCHSNIRLDSTKKRIKIDEDGVETDETIQCPYPGDFGGICRFKVELMPVRGKRIFPFRMQNGEMRDIRVDALYRKV